jgi:hypothetical protein
MLSIGTSEEKVTSCVVPTSGKLAISVGTVVGVQLAGVLQSPSVLPFQSLAANKLFEFIKIEIRVMRLLFRMRELPFQKSKTSFASTYFTLGKKTSLFAISKLFKIILAGWFKGKF